MDFSNFTLNPVTMLILILGLVEFVKRLGLKGNVLIVVSMAIGIILGILYQLGIIYPDLSKWIYIFAFGIASGLAACGVYEAIDKRFPKSKILNIR